MVRTGTGDIFAGLHYAFYIRAPLPSTRPGRRSVLFNLFNPACRPFPIDCQGQRCILAAHWIKTLFVGPRLATRYGRFAQVYDASGHDICKPRDVASKMKIPQLTIEQVAVVIPSVSNIQEVDRGGQKIVFSGIIDGRKYALKFMAPNPSQVGCQNSEFLDDVTSRAQREVETMQQCSTPHLVGMGPIGLNTTDITGEPIIYFSEEFVEGQNLRSYLQSSGVLSVTELVRLAKHISEAIKAIWQFSKIHRDIKPQNIMRRSSNGEFILLDMGFVFDLEDDSLSNMYIVGTKKYYSPEQMDYFNRRTSLSFRSDLFSLGIVLYEMATGAHPFISHDTRTSEDVLRSILYDAPLRPSQRRNGIPEKLSDIIMRLLAKRPALRYRSIELFQRSLGEIEIGGGVQ